MSLTDAYQAAVDAVDAYLDVAEESAAAEATAYNRGDGDAKALADANLAVRAAKDAKTALVLKRG
jgi:uncharacterized protein (DUF2336 family)